MRRYEICWVRLEPVEGSEIGKTRPCVIVSLDVLNRAVNTVVVCPLTSRLHPQWRTRLHVTCGGKPAEICVDQIRTVAKRRLGQKIGELDAPVALALRRLIHEMYGQP